MQFIPWISDRWRLGHRFRIPVFILLTLFLITVLYPFRTTTVPQWDLRVVNDAGEPVDDIKVTEHWQDYLLESEGHEEVQTTGSDGRVSFSVRGIRASAVSRLLARISHFGSRAGRTRARLYGAVVVWGKKDHETSVAVYEGEVPQAEIRVQRLH